MKVMKHKSDILKIRNRQKYTNKTQPQASEDSEAAIWSWIMNETSHLMNRMYDVRMRVENIHWQQSATRLKQLGSNEQEQDQKVPESQRAIA